jgi:hypothetical protein
MWQPKYLLSSVILIILLISSCSDTGTDSATSIMTAENTETSTSTPERTSTLTPAPTETKPATIPLPPIKTQCISDLSDNQKLDLSGVVALSKIATLDNSEFGFYLTNLKNRNIIRDVNEGMFAQVSPDKKSIAYMYDKGDTSFLGVINNRGKTLSDFEFTFDGQMVDYFNWQNSEQLRILYEDFVNNKLFTQLLNPFTQEYTPLRTNLSEVYTPKNPFQDKLVKWKFDFHATSVFDTYGANILYDPSLTRVLYPKDNGIVSLVNAENEVELANTQLEDWGKLPSWSPDGQYLSIVGWEGNADEFYLTSRDGGEFQRITNFSEELGFGSISEAVWSPDSKHIAFWLNTKPGEQKPVAQSELAILDVATRQVTRLCIQGISRVIVKPWIMGHAEPIWSPDGRYLLITQWDDPNSPKNYYVLAIDTQTGALEKVSKNTEPLGWMSDE